MSITFFSKSQSCDAINLERSIFNKMAGTGKLFVFKTDVFWSQIKTAGLVIPYFFKCDHGSTTLPIQYLTLLTITVLPLTTV